VAGVLRRASGAKVRGREEVRNPTREVRPVRQTRGIVDRG